MGGLIGRTWDCHLKVHGLSLTRVFGGFYSVEIKLKKCLLGHPGEAERASSFNHASISPCYSRFLGTKAALQLYYYEFYYRNPQNDRNQSGKTH